MNSTRIIELVEWEKAKRVTLSSDEANKLRRLEKHLDVKWDGGNEAAISGKAGYVGIASLSDETQVIVHPHIPIANVLELTCYAYELEPPEKWLIEDARLDDVGPAEWLAFLLTREVEKLLSMGLRYGYREVEEDLPYVRGRIDFGALRWGESNPGLVPCRFEDFVLDTVENRILRGILELLSGSLLSDGCRRRLRSVLAAFGRVKLVRPSTLMFHRVALTRMTSYYEPASGCVGSSSNQPESSWMKAMSPHQASSFPWPTSLKSPLSERCGRNSEHRTCTISPSTTIAFESLTENQRFRSRSAQTML